MNDINKIFFELNNNIPAFNSNDIFLTDMFFINKISKDNYLHRMYQYYGHTTYLFDFYLCMLCAGIDEDMIFTLPEGAAGIYDFIESIIDIYEPWAYSDTWFDPCVAVYSGRLDFAKKLMDMTEYYIYDRLIEAECWDFIDKITDFGKNEKHIEIITELLVKDYLRGKDNFFEYAIRYNKNELLTCGEAIDNALLEINSADKLFMGISRETKNILNKFAPDTDRKKFNERTIDLMQRCVRLGQTLKEFQGFDNILLPLYVKEETVGGSFILCRECLYCPDDVAKLIDENTMVYVKYEIRKDKTVSNNDDDDCCENGDGFGTNIWFDFPGCYLTVKSENNITEAVDELEYICKDFRKRYGRRLTVRIENTCDFFRIQDIPKDIFDIYLCESIMKEFYQEINSLKKVLNYGMLSQKNIDEITAYFVSRLNSSRGKEYSFALKRLNQLNKKLSKMRGKIQ